MCVFLYVVISTICLINVYHEIKTNKLFSIVSAVRLTNITSNETRTSTRKQDLFPGNSSNKDTGKFFVYKKWQWRSQASVSSGAHPSPFLGDIL